MSKDFIRALADDLDRPMRAWLAGCALLTVLMLRLVTGPEAPAGVGYWIALFFGVAMMVYGSTALTLYRPKKAEELTVPVPENAQRR